MPRQPRNFEVGGLYHIVKRATEGRKIFMKSQDSHRFILGLEFCNSKKPTDLWSLIVGSDPTEIAKRLEEQRNKKQCNDKP